MVAEGRVAATGGWEDTVVATLLGEAFTLDLVLAGRLVFEDDETLVDVADNVLSFRFSAAVLLKWFLNSKIFT